MAKATYRLKITVDEQDRRLFAAGAATLGLTPSQMVENLVSDWVSVNRNNLAKLASDSTAPEGQISTALELLADAGADKPPAKASARRSRRPAK